MISIDQIINEICEVKGRLMNNKGIVKYIEHYMHKDISKGAVMLTGSWGIGKSHFIQNELIPEIQKDEDKKCVCVSLYGLKMVSEISKSIYFELRTKKFKKDSEAVTTGIMAAKTVFRGVTSFFGVDLKASDDEMKELYESIDLKNKLIILEDIERCQIGILDLLYHYYGTANKNYHEYLCEDMVKYKKYFYVLRPILACKWIEEKKCPPPVLFDELFNIVLEEDMKAAVQDLLEKKVKMSEADKAPKIDVINKYIEEKLVYYKELVDSMADDRNPDWDSLEDIFRKIVV